MKAKNFRNIIIISQTYLLFILICFVFRLILFISEFDRLGGIAVEFSNILVAFWIGIRFDIVVAGYLLILPFLLMTIMSIINRQSKYLDFSLRTYILLTFSLVYVICAADIPYFGQFFQRFSIGAFQWADSPDFVVGMIFQEPKYYLYAIPLILAVVITYFALKKIFNPGAGYKTERGYLIKSSIGILAILLIFIGIRGRIHHKSPISAGTAYFCDNAFLNQLGLNPAFTLFRSYLDHIDERNSTIILMDDELAIANVRRYLNIQFDEFDSPIARNIRFADGQSPKMNVVIIIMESMSAAKMTRHGNINNLTPFLDSIANHGLYFENVYTSGKHTFSGIFSTLFSMPTMYRKHPMKEVVIKKYSGIASTLKNHYYTTAYFTTHDGQFDNVEGFLRHNDFDYIFSEKNYPAGDAKTTLGVPDDIMFKYSMTKLDEMHMKGKPFLAAFMTSSDHGPYYIPEYFIPKTKAIKNQIVEYADWSLRQFISSATEKSWFDNTIFVFVADHGVPISTDYEISLDYHHTPLLMYAPKIITQTAQFDQLGSQIDVFPTIMGLLKLPYVNNTLGIDLLRESRPYTILNDDDKIGILSPEYLLILKRDSKALYNYIAKDKRNCIDDNKQIADELEVYAKSQLQTYQYMLNTDKQSPKP